MQHLRHREFQNITERGVLEQQSTDRTQKRLHDEWACWEAQAGYGWIRGLEELKSGINGI